MTKQYIQQYIDIIESAISCKNGTKESAKMCNYSA